MRKTFVPDPSSAWPEFQHPDEVGGRPEDCQKCKSPRIYIAGDARFCASCNYRQKPSNECLKCGCDLNDKSIEMKLGLCTQCRNRISDQEKTHSPSEDWP